MINIHTKHIKIAGLLYLSIPILIFFVGWLKWYISIPSIILILYSISKIIKNIDNIILTVSLKKLILILGVLLLWVVLSGIGQYCWQNKDFLWRNAIFNDLLYRDWPVNNGENTFTYYLGFWLPAALLGKLFHSFAIANLVQLIWAWAGIVLFFFLISEYLKKIKLGVLFILILFSGIDIVPYSIYFLKLGGGNLSQLWSELSTSPHIEWCTGSFQASSITTLLFWVFNQTIPFFVGMMLILLINNIKYKVFVYSLLLLFSPFPFIGLAPVMIYYYIKELKSLGFTQFCKQLLNIETLISLIVILIVGFFFLSNIAGEKYGHQPFDKNYFRFYLMFLLSQYIIYLIFVFKNNKKDWVLIIMCATAIIFPFIKMGEGDDFCIRTNIPFIIYLMLLVMKEIYSSDIKKWQKRTLIVILFLGAVTPGFEIGRTVAGTIICVRRGKDFRQKITNSDSIFDEKLRGPNFLGTKESLFYRYIAK